MVKVPQTRCPHCSALLARGADWCSLCLTDLRPAPIEPVRESEPALVGGAGVSRSTPASPLDYDGDASQDSRERLMALAEISEVAHRGDAVDQPIDPAPTRPRGRHARPSADSFDDAVRTPSLADALTAIRVATDHDPAATRREIDAIDLSVLAGDGMPNAISEWSVKAQAPGAKVGIMAAGVAVVGGIGLLLLTIVGLVLR